MAQLLQTGCEVKWTDFRGHGSLGHQVPEAQRPEFSIVLNFKYNLSMTS